jgi:Brp/Blh family beta-carotene 15,15'-monooxygenase
MRYVDSSLFKIQLIIQLILIACFFFMQSSLNTQALLCGILLCTIGIPHGSNDYIYRAELSKHGLLKFVIIYLTIMLIYLIVWWYFPILALIIFFLISIHHFGQSNFENTSLVYLPSILWGTWVLLFPVVIHYNTATTIFNQMIHPFKIGLQLDAYVAYENIDLFKILIIAGFALIYFITLNYFESKVRFKYLLQFALVTIWFVITPLLFGFILFFSFWHSLQSLKHQSQFYTSVSQKNRFDFILKMLPFSIIALGSFAIYVYFRGFIISEAFILLSIITLPHVIVMHRLYNKSVSKYSLDI